MLTGAHHAYECAGREVLHQHVTVLDQALEDLLALRIFAVDGDRALVAVKHCEIEAVGALHVAQLAAGDVADAGPLDLDDIGAHVSKELRAGRTGLHVGEVKDLHALECLAGLPPRLARGLGLSVRSRRSRLERPLRDEANELTFDSEFLDLRFRLETRCHERVPNMVHLFASYTSYAVWFSVVGAYSRLGHSTLSASECFHCVLYFLRTTLCGLRFPMRPLSVPAAGSITALMRVGLPESMAASTARLSSSGVVT